jgi:Kef-type K+ transport system membrane component KefB
MAAITTSVLQVRILLALATILAGSRAVGWAISKIGQPQVHGEILAGILLGPSLLGWAWPQALSYLFPTQIITFLNVLAQVAVVLFMFLVGLSLDLNRLRGHGHKAVVISHASIITPIALGAVLSIWLYPRLGGGVDRLGFILFFGAAMAITAFPVLARVLQETGLTDTRVGVLAITCAAVDDVTAWCLLAVVVAVVHSSGFPSAARTIALSLLFLVAALKVVKPMIGRFSTFPLWLAICLPLIGGWTTSQIGIHAIFGGFIAGAVIPRRPELQAQIRQRLEPVIITFLLPIFFVVVGLSTRVGLLNTGYLWAVTALIIVTAIAGKWGGSMLAARVMGEKWQDAAAIGILMNTRGLTELIILSVGLQLKVISPTVFTIMVLMALTTTLMATPMLALISPLYHRGQTPTTEVPVEVPAEGTAEDAAAGATTTV